MQAIEIVQDVYWIGVNDRTTDLFEGIWPISKQGIVNNAYLINDEKKAIIESAKAFQQDDFLKKISEIANPSEIDYIIINHMEPDHSGVFEELARVAPKAVFIGTNRTVDLLKAFYDITDRITPVSDGDEISLGSRTLKFISTPMVHWPETMMTFDAKDGILFTGDGFGGYGALADDIFDDSCSDLDYYLTESLRYFTNVVARFSTMVSKAIEKVASLPVNVIAPSHGLIWRKEPKRIIDLYERWASYGTGPAVRGVTVIHGSMYGNTDLMLNTVITSLKETGVPFVTHDASRTHVSYILPSLWTQSAVILGTPTYEAGLFVPVAHILDMAERKKIGGKKVFRFGSYGWSGGAQKEIEQFMAKMKWELVNTLEFNGRPSDDELTQGANLVKEFVKNV